MLIVTPLNRNMISPKMNGRFCHVNLIDSFTPTVNFLFMNSGRSRVPKNTKNNGSAEINPNTAPIINTRPACSG
jgi:hypothetical protein